jgi:rhamnogalacturonyl hydrolase YesR
MLLVPSIGWKYSIKPLAATDDVAPTEDIATDRVGSIRTGTALFTYGMAWGIRQGLLDANVYGPVVTKAWCALVSAVHTNGFLGYAQGTGSKPSDGQPVTFDSTPNFADYPVGCFLLAGSEVWKLASS